MFESFAEYMWYLLTTPYKMVKKSINNWYILCQVFGKRFDEAKEDILRARDEGMVATCSHAMLQIHGADRRITQYVGEDPENYRSRVAMYEEICRLGGTNEGVLLAVRTLGYDSPKIVRAIELIEDAGDRWAEFYIIIDMDVDEKHPISFNILQKTVRLWKEVGAKDNYFFSFHVTSPVCDIMDDCSMALLAQGTNLFQGLPRAILLMVAETPVGTGLTVEIKNNLFYLDGTYMLDGAKPLNTYEMKEDA